MILDTPEYTRQGSGLRLHRFSRVSRSLERCLSRRSVSATSPVLLSKITDHRASIAMVRIEIVVPVTSRSIGVYLGLRSKKSSSVRASAPFFGKAGSAHAPCTCV